MSRSANAEAMVRLTINAGDPAAEIFVIDGQFGLVAQGLGYMETTVAPGLYKIKFKAGSLIKEVHQIVPPDRKWVTVNEDPLPFSSPAPLPQTQISPDFHRDHAQRLSRQVHETLGSGGQLFLFVRDVGDVQGAQTDNVAHGLSLHTPAGELLLDLGRAAEHHGPEQWAGLTIALKPDTYRLRLDTGADGWLEQSLVISPDWQTQLFLLRRDYGAQSVERDEQTGPPTRRPDLANASLMMARPDQGFIPDEEGLRYTELARQGLVNRRQVVSKQDLHDMLWEKYQNPLLGIYGAHLLLLEPAPNWGLLETVVRNLSSLVGPHPDVLAPALRLAQAGGPSPAAVSFAQPPMLRSSWRVAVQASITRPDLIPAGSLSAQIADRIWDVGPWLLWVPPGEAGDAALESAGVTRRDETLSLPEAVLQVASALSELGETETLAAEAELSDMEAGLVNYVTRLTQPATKGGAVSFTPGTSGQAMQTEADLVQAMGLPPW